MLIAMSCLWPCSSHSQGIFFVCTCFVHSQIIYCSQTWSRMHRRLSIVAVIQQSITSVALLNSHRRRVILSMYVWMVWVASLWSHVSVCLQDHVCTFSLVHTLSHFSEVLRTRSPSGSQIFSSPLNRSNLTQNSVEAPINPFQATLPTRWSINLLAGQLENLTQQSPQEWFPSKIP